MLILKRSADKPTTRKLDADTSMCYGDFIKKEEVPENWGLIYYINNKFKIIKYPCGNVWDDKLDRDLQGEIIMLINYILCHKFFNHQRYCFNKRYKEI